MKTPGTRPGTRDATGTTSFCRRVAAAVRHFVVDRCGIAASEFALLLPVMLTFVIGTVEVGSVVILDRKITSATQTGADLIAQATTINAAEIADIFEAMDVILEPYDVVDAGATVYSVLMDAGGSLSIDWTESIGTGAPTATTSLPVGLLQPGGSVIVAEMNYRYRPIFADYIFGEFDIADRAFLRPRRSASVAMN